MIYELPHVIHQVTGDWVQEQVEWIWGFRLYEWQLEDQLKSQMGGVYAFMYGTDHGKSMQIEIDTVLSCIRNANTREIIIKINDAAAYECAEELARRLQKASTRYPAVEPMVQWRNESPFGVSKGFWLKGANFIDAGRNTNRSVRCYGLGSTDLQGKRGRTKIDDIETEEHASSEARRTQLEGRLDSALRTLEAEEIDKMGLWAIYGTPQHEGSVYNRLPAKLKLTGVPHEIVKRPAINPDGSYLMPSRAAKIAIHKATMSKSAYAAAYELKPLAARRPSLEQIETLIKRKDMQIPRDQTDFTEWLTGELYRAAGKVEALAMLAELEFYDVWDPATTGDFAAAVIAKLQRHTFVLRSTLAVMDTFAQAELVGGYLAAFPDATVVVEKNAQQKAFKDVFEMRFPEALIVGHGTYANKDAGNISIPAMIAEMRAGYFHIPWANEDESEAEFGDLINEISTWSITSHPHIVPAIWFGWYWSNKQGGDITEAQALPPGTPETVQMVQPRPLIPYTHSMLSQEEDGMRQRAREAWGRRHVVER